MKRSLFAAALLAGTAVCAITPAFAQVEVDRGRNVAVQDRARPEYDALGTHLGAFDIFPSVSITAETTDNVFATDQASKTSDVSISVRPYVTANSTWSRHSLHLAAGANNVTYNDADTDNHTDGFAEFDARFDLFRDASLGFGASYADNSEPRTAAESAGGADELVEYTKAGSYLTASTLVGRFRFTARADRTAYDYDDTTISGVPFDQDYRDHDETNGTLRVEYALSPDTALVAQGGVNKREYDTPGRDSDGGELLFGINTDISNLIRGELLVGKTEQNYDDPSIGKTEGLAVRGKVLWFPTEITTVTFNASREVVDTGVVGANGVLTGREGIRIDHELKRNVILSGGFSTSQAEYNGIARDDKWTDADVGVTYLMNRHVGISAGYYYSEFTSDGAAAGNDYNVNRFMVSLNLKL